MKRTTLKDLAQYLSLSTSTISRALLNNKNIHPETLKRVLDAAEKLGYKPNITALNLKYGKTRSIGFVVPEMVTPFSAKVLEGVHNVLYPLGYRIIILQSDEDPVRERENLLLLESYNVDGIIINLCHETYNTDIYQQIIKRGTPMVFFDRIPDKALNISKVIVDDYIKSSLMVEHLITCGRSKIVHLMGPSTVRNSLERAGGYERTLTKHKLYDPMLKMTTDKAGFQDGRNAARKLLESKIKFDSIFAFTDTLAIGAMNYLQEKGIKIPQDIAVASFSGTELSTNVFPQLTSVEQPLTEMGATAAELIIENISESSNTCRTIILEAKLTYRASTLG